MPQIDHRLALVLLSTIIVAAAVPLAVAWARLLPADSEPFSSVGGQPDATAAPRDPLAVALLCSVTVSYLAQFPGVPFESLRLWLDARLTVPWPEYLFLVVVFLLVFAPAGAACYAVLRSNPLRAPLIWAGVLILLVWFASPYLLAALTASS